MTGSIVTKGEHTKEGAESHEKGINSLGTVAACSSLHNGTSKLCSCSFGSSSSFLHRYNSQLHNLCKLWHSGRQYLGNYPAMARFQLRGNLVHFRRWQFDLQCQQNCPKRFAVHIDR